MNELIPYNDQSLSQNYKFVTEYGKLIAVRLKTNYFINLYLVEDTFFELWFFRPTHRIARIEQLKDQKKLELYTNQMID